MPKVLSTGFRARLAAVLVLIVAVEGAIFAFVLYGQAMGADGHFRGGFTGFLFHLALLMLALTGLRALGRKWRPIESV